MRVCATRLYSDPVKSKVQTYIRVLLTVQSYVPRNYILLPAAMYTGMDISNSKGIYNIHIHVYIHTGYGWIPCNQVQVKGYVFG